MTENWNRASLLETVGAFRRARIIMSAAQLDIFSKLASRPSTAEDLVRREGWGLRGAVILLDALVALGLISKSEQGEYRTMSGLEKWLTSEGEDSLVPMFLHGAALWNTWGNITEIVRSGRNPSPLDNDSRSDEDLAAFIGAMDVMARPMSEKMAASLDLSSFTHLLDVGGGPGTYTKAFLERNPRLNATLFDLPKVVPMAAERLHKAGLADRVRFVEGDYHTDPLPGGHDAVWLSAVIHSNSRAANKLLFQKIFDSLDKGGTVFIRDYFLNAMRTAPVEGAIFSVNMLAATEYGDNATYEEVREDLEAVGFSRVEMILKGERMDQVVAAVK
jgi:SAM-dependent methyltransferase